MLSAHFPSLKSAYKYILSFSIFILLAAAAGASHGGTVESSAASPTEHLNFFRSTLRSRQRTLTCAKDPSVCLDREKNPWGGSTCCFRRFCKDTRNDPKHCGECGRICAFGQVCCDGNCVDTHRDPKHCGACFEVCPGQTKCSYAMCDYGG